MKINKSDLRALSLIKVGIEKEGLRLNKRGKLSTTEHQKSLGSKLTHPYITTDYSESLIEFVTPAFTDFTTLEQFLIELHKYTYLKDQDELIWPASMPCELPVKDSEIDIADFGSSNIGKLKKLYRLGLGHRYGRKMQCIAGLHYNFSVSSDLLELIAHKKNLGPLNKESASFIYFDLIKNFRRHSWILLYLFGASPVVDKSFLVDREHDLQELSKDTFGLPYATSLRMGGLGYTSKAQKDITVCFNQLDRYIESIEKARTTPYQEYEKLGVKVNGEYKQLNANLIQIDNEFYANIRPKAIAKSGMSALQALDKFGIEYVEVRLLDLDPFSPVGISRETNNFLKSFLLFCLLEDSPIISDDECSQIDANHLLVVREGRKPGLEIEIDNEKVLLKDRALEIIDKISKYAVLLDETHSTNEYSSSLSAQKEKVNDPSLTPSARILSLLENNSYIEKILEISQEHKRFFQSATLDSKRLEYFDNLAIESWQQQKKLDSDDSQQFDDYIEQYFSQIKLDKSNA